MTLTPHAGLKNKTHADFPQDSMVTCWLAYNGAASKGTKDDPGPKDRLVIEVPSQYTWKYNKETQRIERSRDLSAADRHEHIMAINKGYDAKMRMRVNEITESFIDGNGQKKSEFQIYYTGFSLPQSIPYQKPQSEDFKAQIQFYFDLQYNYNSYKAPGIDSMVKFGTSCIYIFLIWAIGCLVVKYRFYKELDEEIFLADKEVQQMKGL